MSYISLSGFPAVDVWRSGELCCWDWQQDVFWPPEILKAVSEWRNTVWGRYSWACAEDVARWRWVVSTQGRASVHLAASPHSCVVLCSNSYLFVCELSLGKTITYIFVRYAILGDLVRCAFVYVLLARGWVELRCDWNTWPVLISHLSPSAQMPALLPSPFTKLCLHAPLALTPFSHWQHRLALKPLTILTAPYFNKLHLAGGGYNAMHSPSNL